MEPATPFRTVRRLTMRSFIIPSRSTAWETRKRVATLLERRTSACDEDCFAIGVGDRVDGMADDEYSEESASSC
jgi:hypothetical protein